MPYRHMGIIIVAVIILPMILCKMHFFDVPIHTSTTWNILFMAPRIKLIEMCNLLWSEFVETNATCDASICFYRSVEADRNVAHRFDKLAPK